jgi:DNA-binding transcriptional ArsR family regulator
LYQIVWPYPARPAPLLNLRPGDVACPYTLAPRCGYSVDFLTPSGGTTDLDAGIDEVLHTPRPRLRADLAQLGGQLRPWRRSLTAGEPAALRRLGRALREYHGAALAEHWPSIRAHVDADLLGRARTLCDSGVERLLSSLHPVTIHWRHPTLHIAYPYDRDIHLDGRGLRLVPGFFCWLKPITVRATEHAPVLVYPIDHRLDWSSAEGPPIDARLPALLGNTRAAVLQTVAAGAGYSATDIAQRVGISMPSTSHHTTVLREAGLIATRQQGRHVMHAVTPLGLALLAG